MTQYPRRQERNPTTNGVRAFQLPTGLTDGAIFTITLSNTSGGALTMTTFAAGYHGTETLPADTTRRSYQFKWDATAGVAYFMFESDADVPN